MENLKIIMLLLLALSFSYATSALQKSEIDVEQHPLAPHSLPAPRTDLFESIVDFLVPIPRQHIDIEGGPAPRPSGRSGRSWDNVVRPGRLGLALQPLRNHICHVGSISRTGRSRFLASTEGVLVDLLEGRRHTTNAAGDSTDATEDHGTDGADSSVREVVLEALGGFVERFGDRVDHGKVIAAVLSQLDSQCEHVRFQALKALVRVVGPPRGQDTTTEGNKEIIAAVVERLAKEEKACVRKEALSALVHIAEPGNDEAVAAVLKHLDRKDELREDEKRAGSSSRLDEQRADALRALAKIAERGDKKVIAAVVNQLNRVDPEEAYFSTFWGEAIRTMARIAEKGNVEAISAVLRNFENAKLGHRFSDYFSDRDYITVLRTLREITEPGDVKVVAAILALFPSRSASVLQEAIQVLRAIAKRGDKTVIATMSGLLGYQHGGSVRRDAFEALGEVALKGDTEVIAAILAALLGGPNLGPHEMRTALGVLGEIAGKGDAKVIATILSRVRVTGDHPLPPRRLKVVLDVLVRIAERGDVKVVATVSGLLANEDGDVREHAVWALGKVAERGDVNVIKAILDMDCGWYLDPFSGSFRDPLNPDGNDGVMLNALVDIAGQGDAQVIATLLGRVAEESISSTDGCHNRVGVALYVLVHIIEKGEGANVIVSVILGLFTHEDWQVPELLQVVWCALADMVERGVVERETVISAIVEDHLLACPSRGGPVGVMAAFRALRNIGVQKGDGAKVITAVSGFLSDEDPGVRGEAACILGNIAERGDEEVIAAVSVLLVDADRGVRRQAARALKKIAEREEQERTRE